MDVAKVGSKVSHVGLIVAFVKRTREGPTKQRTMTFK